METFHLTCKKEGGENLSTLGPIKALPGLAPKYYGINQLAERSQLCPVDQPEFLRDKTRVVLICSRHIICKNAFFSDEDFQHCKTAFFMKLAKLHYYSNLLNSLLNNPLITETDQLYISCQALSSV